MCPALLVLITADFVILVGRGEVMGFLLGLVKSASAPFMNEVLSLFNYPPGSGRALACWYSFLFGIVLRGLLVGFLLGLCRCLVMLLVWFVQVLVLRLMVRVKWVVRRFTGLVVLSWWEKNSTKQKKTAHLVGRSMHSRPRVWKWLHCSGVSWCSTC